VHIYLRPKLLIFGPHRLILSTACLELECQLLVGANLHLLDQFVPLPHKGARVFLDFTQSLRRKGVDLESLFGRLVLERPVFRDDAVLGDIMRHQ
jgi:hypothetical protein